MDTLQLVKLAAEGNPTQFQDAFDQLIAPKIVDAVAAKKIEVAQSYLAPSQQEPKDSE